MEVKQTNIPGLLIIQPNLYRDARGYFFESYNKDSEGSVRWNDPELAINWGIENPLVSDKDREAPFFKDLHSLF